MSLNQVYSEISQAIQASGRTKGTVELIAVSKVQPNERVLSVLNQGHQVFGENRVQEAEGKWPEFKSSFPDAKVHLLGPLQSNKARAALQLFDCIHTLDRPKLATTFSRLAQELGQCPPLFAQVNTGLEAQKAGIAPGCRGCLCCGLQGIRPATCGLDVHSASRRRGQHALCTFGQVGQAK